MVIILEKIKSRWRFGRTQYRYAVIYIIITLVFLVILNVYCAQVCQRIIFQGKETTTISKLLFVAEELGKLDSLSVSSVSDAVESISSLNINCITVTDQDGTVIFCSDGCFVVDEAVGSSYLFQAMEGYDVFAWSYGGGVIRTEAAVPVISNGVTVGCVYSMETDTAQGALIASLQSTIMIITCVLELVVIAFSLMFAKIASGRMQSIMDSIRIVQEGDFTHKLAIDGHDEYTVLASEFNDLTARLHSSEQTRRQFVSDASHELKTPLASIKLLADSIVQNDMDLQTTREFAQDIGNEAERLNRMSEKLLALSRGDDPGPQISAVVDMASTIERVVNMLSPLARSHGVTIQTELDQGVQALIQEDDLYQIVFNLAENGIKYNAPGGMLTLRLGRRQDLSVLTVQDTGCGIPEESLPHIFERFYRVDKARSRASGGSGLGLSIVHSMVQRNHGSIQVASTLGAGTTFTVTFPDPSEEKGETV